METTDLTVQILRSIRDGVHQTNERLDQTNQRLDQTNQRLDQTNQRLEAMGEDLGRRIVEGEMRTATALTELAGSVHDLAELLRGQADLRPRVECCERDIAALKQRIGSS